MAVGVGGRLGIGLVDRRRRDHRDHGQVDPTLARGPDAGAAVARSVGGGVQLRGVDARSLVDVVDAVAAGDGLGRVQLVADVDVGEQPVEPVALVLGRVELEGDGLAIERALGEGGRLGAVAGLGLGRMDDLGRIDADDPDGLEPARQLDPDGVAVDDLDDGPGEGRRRRRQRGSGAVVGDGVGATDCDGETDGDDAGVGDEVAAVTVATSWSVPPPTAAASAMTAPATNRLIFLRDTWLEPQAYGMPEACASSG